MRTSISLLLLFPLAVACSAAGSSATDGSDPSSSGSPALSDVPADVDLLRGGEARVTFKVTGVASGTKVNVETSAEGVSAKDATVTSGKGEVVLTAAESTALGNVDVTLSVGDGGPSATVHVDVRLAPGSGDDSFADGGNYVYDDPTLGGTYVELGADALAPLADGSIYVLGHRASTTSETDRRIAFAQRIAEGGKLLSRPTPPPGSQFDLLALQADGGLVVVRTDNNGAGDDRSFFRIDPSGAVDKGWGTAGVTTLASDVDSAPGSHAQRPDGSVIASLRSHTQLVALTADGKLDESFGTAGQTAVLPIPPSDVIVPLPTRDGHVYVVAGISSYDVRGSTAPGLWLLRLDHAGRLDTTFGTKGVVTVTPAPERGIEEACLDDEERIVIHGDKALLRLKLDGTVDTTYGDGGVTELGPRPTPADGYRASAWLTKDEGRGGVFVAYGDGDSNGFTGHVVRVDASGRKDPAFVMSKPGPVGTFLQLPGRKLLLGGSAPASFFRKDDVNVTRAVLVVQRIFL